MTSSGDIPTPQTGFFFGWTIDIAAMAATGTSHGLQSMSQGRCLRITPYFGRVALELPPNRSKHTDIQAALCLPPSFSGLFGCSPFPFKILHSQFLLLCSKTMNSFNKGGDACPPDGVWGGRMGMCRHERCCTHFRAVNLVFQSGSTEAAGSQSHTLCLISTTLETLTFSMRSHRTGVVWLRGKAMEAPSPEPPHRRWHSIGWTLYSCYNGPNPNQRCRGRELTRPCLESAQQNGASNALCSVTKRLDCF